MHSQRIGRREFLKSAALSSAAILATPHRAFAFAFRDTRLRVLSIGVVGTIGGHDRRTIASHPAVDLVGLCDVDDGALSQALHDHPGAWTCKDYREAFDKHGDKFDAVIVATPDHSHCSIMTLALARHKHVYGQKPLVQQLEELKILSNAAKARPSCVTQTGAQRIEHPARRAAVHILKSGALGKVIEVHIAFGGSARAGNFYFADGKLGEPCDPPSGFDHDLWLCGASHEPCRPQMVQRQWRSWWRYGGGQIADWSVHLADILFYAFPELESPTRVCTRTSSRDLSHFHADKVLSTLSYPVKSEKFANSVCNFHFYDSGMRPDRGQLGLGEAEWPGGIFTVVACEGGTLVLAPEGPLEIWRDGIKTDGLAWPGLPTIADFNHWHAWVDAAIGSRTPHLWMPFEIGLRCTEPGLLAVKAAVFPGEDLAWNRSKLEFVGNTKATKSLVRREYRRGFEPVRL